MTIEQEGDMVLCVGGPVSGLRVKWDGRPTMLINQYVPEPITSYGPSPNQVPLEPIMYYRHLYKTAIYVGNKDARVILVPMDHDPDATLDLLLKGFKS